MEQVMKANFKLTVIGRISASFNEPISISKDEFQEIVRSVFHDTELEPRSYNKYKKDLIELAEKYELKEKLDLELEVLIPELTKS